MTSELESKLHAALHERGSAITAERLRPTRPIASARRRSAAARLAPLLAAVAVVALVASIAMLSRGGSHPGRPVAGGSTSSADVKGNTWVLTTVVAPDGTTTAIPASADASVTFLPTGNRIEFQDGRSVFSATYDDLGDGALRVHDVDGAYSGDCPGLDVSQRAAVAGIDAIGVPLGRDAPAPIQVELVSSQLRITAQGYVLTLSDPVPVATSAARLPSSPPAGTTTTSASAAQPGCG